MSQCRKLEDSVSKIPKHEATKRKPKTPTQPQPLPDYRDSSSVAESIDRFASIFSTYVTQARNGDNGASMFTHPDGYPVKVALEQGEQGSNPIQLTLSENDYDDTMNRFVTALERIADAVAKIAGLSRPRLESWHEQDEYEPRCKDIAVDGGAPGPKTTAAEGNGHSRAESEKSSNTNAK